MNVILMGYRCSGKSTVGRRVAERLGFAFCDTDQTIERQAGLPIPRIVAERGWEAFRDLERAAIGQLSGTDRRVIALGGGAILDPRNVDSLKQGGFLVWLTADAETIAARMQSDEAGGNARPSLTATSSIDEIGRVLAEREPLYRRLADLCVDTAGIGPEQVAEAVCACLRKRLAQRETLR